jgi:hypothetical protein
MPLFQLLGCENILVFVEFHAGINLAVWPFWAMNFLEAPCNEYKTIQWCETRPHQGLASETRAEDDQ